MSKWPLFALVVFVAVLGICYSLLTRQGYRDGGAAGAGPSSSVHDTDELEAESDAKEDDELPQPPTAKIAQRPPLAPQGSGSTVETIEDDEENGVVVDVPAAMDDENGTIEAAEGAPAKASKP